jgi:hypothetical protein
MYYLGYLCILAGFVCQILLAVQAFKRSKILPGILCIICGLFAIIYGFMKADEWGVKNLVIAMTILLLVGGGLYGAFMPRPM